MFNSYFFALSSNVFLLLFALSWSSFAVERSPLCKEQVYNKHSNLFFVSTKGSNSEGTGSRSNPWQSIQVAVERVSDGSTIIVAPGVYKGSINLTKPFKLGITVVSEYPYKAKLINTKRVIAFTGKASNITLEGFEITHASPNSSPLVVHIDGGGNKDVHHIKLKNNIIHDSFNNDLLKINYGAENITVECNMFYNQGDSDEHIDINSVANVIVSDNIFFNDFKKSDRKITKNTSSFIVIKDSNDNSDRFLGSQNITVKRNVFFNWQGSHGHGFILLGEDGKPYYEASNIYIYNNLMIGNSEYSMRSPFALKGVKNVYFYHNTITGNLPSNAYALRVNKEGKNKINKNLTLVNNIWSDISGTMGSGERNTTNDFSDVFYNQLTGYTFSHNVIFNGNNKLPSSFFDLINPQNDKHLIDKDPQLPIILTITSPTWRSKNNKFNDGSFSIREAFIRLVQQYGEPQKNSPVQSSLYKKFVPTYDILGRIRKNKPSRGAQLID